MKTCQLAFKQRTGTTVISSATIPVNMNKLSVNVGESQITQSLKVRDLGVTFKKFSALIITLLLYVEAHVFILEKLGIYYRIMLVLLLFMHLLVVN